MSDLMFYGVLRMPFDMAMSDYLSQRQFYDRAQEATDRVEAADKRIAELEVRLAGQDKKVQSLLNHCPDGECDVCGEIVCPHECGMHFHHDGCPACAEHEVEDEGLPECTDPGCKSCNLIP